MNDLLESLNKELKDLLSLESVYTTYLYEDYLDNDIYGYQESIDDLQPRIKAVKQAISCLEPFYGDKNLFPI